MTVENLDTLLILMLRRVSDTKFHLNVTSLMTSASTSLRHKRRFRRKSRRWGVKIRKLWLELIWFWRDKNFFWTERFLEITKNSFFETKIKSNVCFQFFHNRKKVQEHLVKTLTTSSEINLIQLWQQKINLKTTGIFFHKIDQIRISAAGDPWSRKKVAAKNNDE